MQLRQDSLTTKFQHAFFNVKTNSRMLLMHIYIIDLKDLKFLSYLTQKNFEWCCNKEFLIGVNKHLLKLRVEMKNSS